MTTRDLFEETLTALRANKVRSGLTMLGIIIGITSVIAMVSIGNGAKASISSSIEGLGSNLLIIMPGVVEPGRGIVSAGRGSANTLKNEDLPVIQGIDGVSAVAPERSSRFQVVSDEGNNTSVTVDGVTAVYADVRNVTVADGSFVTDDQDRSLARVAVLGAQAATDLFGSDEPVGHDVRINGSLFHVIGVLASKGGFGASGPDDSVIVPLSTMQKILAGSDTLSDVSVSVADKTLMDQVSQDITDQLTAKHNVDTPDFSIISQADILGTLSTVVNTFTLFLASIAGISLVVGGIGIMNMMLTNVTERTKEIGLRKAIGATERDISNQFLMESVLLTVIGGALGIALGWAIATVVSATGLIAAQMSLSSVLLAFGVSAAIGIGFGWYPARRAARMNPIDALRYE